MSTPKQDQIAQNFKVLNADKTRSPIISDSALNNLAESTQILDTNNKQFEKKSNPSDPAVIFDLVERPYAVKDEDNVFTGVNTFNKDIITCNVVPKTNGEYSLGLTNKRYSIYANDVNTHNIIPATNGDYDIGNSTKSYNALYADKLYTDIVINGSKLDCTSGNTITTSLWGATRSFTIQDASGQNLGTSTSVNGSEAVTLHLPGAIEANVTGNLNGNASSADEADHAETANTASKLGTTTIGGGVNFIYLKQGTPTATSKTVGSSSKPVYMNKGNITAVDLKALKNALDALDGSSTDDPSTPDEPDEPEETSASSGYYYYVADSSHKLVKYQILDTRQTGIYYYIYGVYTTDKNTTYTGTVTDNLSSARNVAENVLNNKCSEGLYRATAAASTRRKIIVGSDTYYVYSQKMSKLDPVAPVQGSSSSGTFVYLTSSSGALSKGKVGTVTDVSAGRGFYVKYDGERGTPGTYVSTAESNIFTIPGDVTDFIVTEASTRITDFYISTVANKYYINKVKVKQVYSGSTSIKLYYKQTEQSGITKGTNVAGSKLHTDYSAASAVSDSVYKLSGDSKTGTWQATSAPSYVGRSGTYGGSGGTTDGYIYYNTFVQIAQ